MQEFRFYINGVEVNEPINWDDLKFAVARDKKYFGLQRKAAIDKLELWGEAYNIVKKEYDLNGFLSEVTFWVERLNYDFLIYQPYFNGVLDFNDIDFDYTLENGDKLTVGVVDSSIYEKINSREKTPLTIGDIISVGGEATSGINYENVLLSSRGREIIDEYQLSDDIDEMYTHIDYIFSSGENYILPNLERVVSNNEFSSAFVSTNLIEQDGVSDPLTSTFDESNIMLGESLYSNYTIVRFDVRFNIYIYAGLGNSVQADFDLVLDEYSYDGSNLTLITREVLGSENVFANSETYTELIYNGEYGFTKNKESVYIVYVRWNVTDPSNSILNPNLIGFGKLHPYTPDYVGKFQVKFEQEEYLPLSLNKGYLIHECFQSLIEQISDTQNVFYSETFGREELGYLQDGEFHDIIVTNGLFLRNAINSDNSDVNLTLEFSKLYDTLNRLIGLSMWLEDGMIRIETRDFAFSNSDIIKIDAQNIKKSVNQDLIFTDLKIGCNNIKYEDVNGANEFNTQMTFSAPFPVKSKSLDMVTSYNTDYLGVELARQLAFNSDANTDTKYDDKVFLIHVKKVAGLWTNVRGEDYASVANIPLPDTASNIIFSPKRCLLRISDLISPIFEKHLDLQLKFKESLNLSSMVSRDTPTSDFIVERDDVVASEMKKRFKPYFWEFELAKRDIWKLFLNQNTLYEFYNGCEKIQGWIWSAEIKKEVAKIKILEKW